MAQAGENSTQTHPSIPSGGGSECWKVAALCLLLAAITAAVFGQTSHFDFVNFDDNVYVYENPLVTGGLTGKGVAWVFSHADCSLYHPLTILSLMVDYQWHGLHPGGYHLANAALHLGSVLLLFLVLRRMTGSMWRSAFVAAVFAIHPLRAESVAWVAERKDVLGTFFFMLTLAAYEYYARQTKSPGRYLMVAGAFALALLSKPTVVTLPFLLLLIDYWPLQRKEPVQRLILEKLPLLAMAIGEGTATLFAAQSSMQSFAHLPLGARLANAAVSYVVYLREMVWPVNLAARYPYPAGGHATWVTALCLLLLTAITAAVIVWHRHRRWLVTGWFWYLGLLAPMIGIMQVGTFAHADRMTYLPQIGICLMLAWLAPARLIFAAVGAAIVAALIIPARTQTAYWRDSETLWKHTLACTPPNDVAEYNFGNVLRKKGQMNDAMGHYQNALAIEPRYAPASVNLGNILLQMGKLDDAITNYQSALQNDPNNAETHSNLGTALRRKGRLDEAVAQFRAAVELKPGSEPPHFNLARAYQQKGDETNAIRQYELALRLKPTDLEVENNLAWLLATAAPASLRNGTRAVELARQANAQAGGKNPVIYGTLAAALAETGKFDEATQAAQQGVGLAEASGRPDMARQINAQLERYKAGAPAHR